MAGTQEAVVDLEIYVDHLTFSHNPSDTRVEPSLVDISLSLPKGSRTILIGANGGMVYSGIK